MAGSGGRDEVQRRVDLTSDADGRERRPSERAQGSDIKAEVVVSLNPHVKISVLVEGNGDSAIKFVGRLVAILPLLAAPLVALGICWAASASTTTTLLGCAASALGMYIVLRNDRLMNTGVFARRIPRAGRHEATRRDLRG